MLCYFLYFSTLFDNILKHENILIKNWMDFCTYANWLTCYINIIMRHTTIIIIARVHAFDLLLNYTVFKKLLETQLELTHVLLLIKLLTYIMLEHYPNALQNRLSYVTYYYWKIYYLYFYVNYALAAIMSFLSPSLSFYDLTISSNHHDSRSLL